MSWRVLLSAAAVLGAVGCGNVLGLSDYADAPAVGGGPSVTAASSNATTGTNGSGGAGGSGGASAGTGGVVSSCDPAPALPPSSCLYANLASDDCPVFFAPFDEPSGSDAFDLVTGMGGKVEGVLGDTDLRGCGASRALRLDANANASWPFGPELDFLDNAAFTVIARVEIAEGDGGKVVHKALGTDNGWALTLGTNATKTSWQVGFRRFIGGASQDHHCGLGPAAPGALTIAGRYDGNEVCVYVGGMQCGCSPSPGMMASSGAPLVVGNSPFVGVVDDVVIYDYPMSDPRIATHHSLVQ